MAVSVDPGPSQLSSEPGAATAAADGGGRATCYTCFRPQALCYCGSVRRVNNRTEIIVLQHPRERFHPIGTARIAALGLQRVRVELDVNGRFSQQREPLLLPPNTGLLYPASPSRDLAEVPRSEMPEHLVVLDGTWHHAHTLYRDVPGLQQLPRFSFQPVRPSEYRLRREPRANYVSTIEAIAHCLRLIEPETAGVEDLLDAFRGMIERQVQARGGVKQGRTLAARRPQAQRRVPRALLGDAARLVVVYGEAFAAPPLRTGVQLVHWTALRLGSGEAFEAVLRPRLPLHPFQEQCAGLTRAELDAGCTEDEFRERWAKFVRADDVLLVWTQRGLLPLTGITGSVAQPCIPLKSVYHNLERAPGSLEEVMRSELMQPVSNPCRGRAGRRLGNAAALTLLLRQLVS